MYFIYYIEYNAFYGSPHLTYITISYGVTSIGINITILVMLIFVTIIIIFNKTNAVFNN